MLRRARAFRSFLGRAARRRRGRHEPRREFTAPAAAAPAAGAAWSVEELGAAALELGLYPEPAPARPLTILEPA